MRRSIYTFHETDEVLRALCMELCAPIIRRDLHAAYTCFQQRFQGNLVLVFLVELHDLISIFQQNTNWTGPLTCTYLVKNTPLSCTCMVRSACTLFQCSWKKSSVISGFLLKKTRARKYGCWFDPPPSLSSSKW